jgi:transglutaminase-like putative cysteine protease
MKRIFRLVLYLLSIAVFPAAVFFGLPVDVPYEVTERYVFAADGRAEAGVALAVMIPINGPYQRVENVAVEWNGSTGKNASGTAEVLRLEGRTGAAGTATAVISYSVLLHQGAVRWTAAEEPRYLDPQTEIESDAPEIVERAVTLKKDTARETAFRIFSFTADYLEWPAGTREGVNSSALAAYRSRVGGCAEFANLAAALARADGIPARTMSGLLFPLWWPPLYARTESWNSPAGAHAWVEIFDGEAWTFTDPSWASNTPGDGFWFGRTVGAHLAYGEASEEAGLYAAMMDWGRAKGEIVGAMSAPMKFVAAAEAAGVSIVPSVTIRKGWDPRWISAAGVYAAVLIAASLIEQRLRTRKTTVAPPARG